ncbi:MAG: PadR family transcriptional regulator [Gemmatimonadota bacterium]
MTSSKSDVLLGTLDLLVLKLLESEPMHGWGLSQQLEEMSGGVFQVNQGSLYPALQRLKTKGMIRSRWATTENGRRARYYELTRSGTEQLAEEVAAWLRTSGAVNRVIGLGLEAG